MCAVIPVTGLFKYKVSGCVMLCINWREWMTVADSQTTHLFPTRSLSGSLVEIYPTSPFLHNYRHCSVSSSAQPRIRLCTSVPSRLWILWAIDLNHTEIIAAARTSGEGTIEFLVSNISPQPCIGILLDCDSRRTAQTKSTSRRPHPLWLTGSHGKHESPVPQATTPLTPSAQPLIRPLRSRSSSVDPLIWWAETSWVFILDRFGNEGSISILGRGA
jgi:hypothetical protein